MEKQENKYKWYPDSWYKAWLYFAPVYYNTKSTAIFARRPYFRWLLRLAINMHHLFVFITTMFFDYSATFPIKITKKIQWSSKENG